MPVDILIIWFAFEPGAQSKFMWTSISVSDVFLETEACLDMSEKREGAAQQ
jgi:hypothetical protein